jgi:hypothetical protein
MYVEQVRDGLCLTEHAKPGYVCVVAVQNIGAEPLGPDPDSQLSQDALKSLETLLEQHPHLLHPLLQDAGSIPVVGMYYCLSFCDFPRL